MIFNSLCYNYNTVMNTHMYVLKESVSRVFNRAQMLMLATLIVQHLVPSLLVVSYTISDLGKSKGEGLVWHSHLPLQTSMGPKY